VGIEEREEGQTKSIRNIFNKKITDNFPNLDKEMPIQVQEDSKSLSRQEQVEPPHTDSR
jgi:hypothetical protein